MTYYVITFKYNFTLRQHYLITLKYQLYIASNITQLYWNAISMSKYHAIHARYHSYRWHGVDFVQVWRQTSTRQRWRLTPCRITGNIALWVVELTSLPDMSSQCHTNVLWHSKDIGWPIGAADNYRKHVFKYAIDCFSIHRSICFNLHPKNTHSTMNVRLCNKEV